jgi:Pentapeptide repeats (8 copies)
MANPEHEEILNQGVAAWNKWRDNVRWRRNDPHDRLELNGHLLRHPLRFPTWENNNRDLMDGLNDEERREAFEALTNESIYYNTYWRDIWGIADLRGINFENVNLAGSTMILADLSGANLRHADLRGINLEEAILRDANLSNANFEGAVLGKTTFSNTDLSFAKGLLSCRHMRPSFVDPSTIHKSYELPQDFLLECGLSTLYQTSD